MSERARQLMAEAGIDGRQHDAAGVLVFDRDNPLAPIKEPIAAASSEDLVPGIATRAIEAMARFGMDDATRLTVRAYVKKLKLMPAAEFDSIVDRERRARAAALPKATATSDSPVSASRRQCTPAHPSATRL
jgi:hypothetical protein